MVGITVSAEPWSVRGPKLWAELHGRALAYQGDILAELAWLADFRLRLHCGDCRLHWEEMVKRTRPDLTSATTYWQWTVDRHNEVNRRLGKAVMGLEAARSQCLAGVVG